MKASEIREMSVEEIQDEIDDASEALMRLRFQLTTGELTDHNQIRATRRNIARMKTILKQRQEEEKEGET
ncbi:MAG: 50S ribosomal protein L29 [Anaerolineales bacterium]|jgi:large subunit ribosomal protein L29